MGFEHGKNIYNKSGVETYYKIVGEDALDPDKMNESDRFLFGLLPKDMTGMTVADLACGNGRFAELFCKRGAGKVIAFDLSDDMLEEANKRKNTENLSQLLLAKADIQHMPLAKDKFDLIFSRFGLIYSENLDETVANTADSLKPGGQLLILVNYMKAQEENSDISFASGQQVILDLFLGNRKLELKHFAYSLADFQTTLEQAGLNIEIETHFHPDNIAVSPKSELYNKVDFDYVVIKATKPPIGE